MAKCAETFTILLVIIVQYRAPVCNSQIVKAPSSQTVAPDDTAVFNCSMSCSQQLPLTWYITVPTSGRTVAVSQYTSLVQVKSIYGIEVTRGTVNECPQGGYIVEQLFVKATQQLNLMPVQCSTVCFGEDCSCSDKSQVYFSKLGVLSIAPGTGKFSSTLSSAPASQPVYRSTAATASCNFVATTVTVTYAPTPMPQATPTQQPFPTASPAPTGLR